MKTFIVAYVIRTTNHNGKTTDHEYYEPFIEYNEMEQSPEEQADERYRLLVAEEGFPENEELYSANICQIIQSTDYDTEPIVSGDKPFFVLWGEEASDAHEEGGVKELLKSAKRSGFSVVCNRYDPPFNISDILDDADGWLGWKYLTEKEYNEIMKKNK